MIVEVTGIPCAGKSTLLPYIYKECAGKYNSTQYASNFLDEVATSRLKIAIPLLSFVNENRRIKVLRNILILSYFISGFFAHFKLHIHILKLVYKNNRTLKALKSYYWKFGKYYTIQHNSEDQCIIIDEGTVHVIQSIYVPSDKRIDENLEGLHKYLTTVNLPDLLIVIHNRNKIELLERLEKRGHHRVNSASYNLFIDNCIKAEDATIDSLSHNESLVIKILPTPNVENRPIF
jgi:hypothetical protein